jgi:hypothetical protein
MALCASCMNQNRGDVEGQLSSLSRYLALLNFLQISTGSWLSALSPLPPTPRRRQVSFKVSTSTRRGPPLRPLRRTATPPLGPRARGPVPAASSAWASPAWAPWLSVSDWG